GDTRRQIVHFKHNPIPSPRLLTASIGQGARSRASRSAEEQTEGPMGHPRERGSRLLFHLESQMLRVEFDRPIHIFDLIADGIRPIVWRAHDLSPFLRGRASPALRIPDSPERDWSKHRGSSAMISTFDIDGQL